MSKKQIKIENIKVSNLRSNSNSMKEINFDQKLKSLNFIIGENGSGKSTFINIMKDIINGTKTKDFSYDTFAMNFNDRELKVHNKIKIKNIYNALHKEAQKNKLDISSTTWERGQANNNEVNNFTYQVNIQKGIRSAILNMINDCIDNTIQSKDLTQLNIQASNEFGAFFNNNIHHSIYRINNILQLSEYFNTKNRISLSNSVKKFLLNDQIDFRDNHYKVKFEDVLLNYSWLIDNEKNELRNMIDSYAKLSNDANVYINNFLFPLKKDDEVDHVTEFIHSERIISDALKRMNLEPPRKADNPIKYEFNKKHEEFLISYNQRKNEILKKIKDKILSGIHTLNSSKTIEPNEEYENEIQKLIKNNTLMELNFIKNIFESTEDISRIIVAYITNDHDLINNIKKVIKMSQTIVTCINNINEFLSDTFNHKIYANDDSIVVKEGEKEIAVGDFNFSTGQKSIIYMLSNLYLTEKMIYIIDEPETGLSIIWQEKLRKVFASMIQEGKQLIVITHSDFIFSNERENICVIPF